MTKPKTTNSDYINELDEIYIWDIEINEQMWEPMTNLFLGSAILHIAEL